MAIVPILIYKFNTIPTKSQAGFNRNYQANGEMYMNVESEVPNIKKKKKKKTKEDLHCLIPKLRKQRQDSMAKVLQYGSVEQIKCPEINPYGYRNLNFSKITNTK
jgi:DNA integrity scanning protein DisA with diadenylate cyclase activity